MSAPPGCAHMKAGDSNDCGHPFAPTPAPASQSGGFRMDSGEPAGIRPHRISTASSRPHFADAQHADTAAPPSYAYRCCAKARQLATHLQHIPIPVSNERAFPGLGEIFDYGECRSNCRSISTTSFPFNLHADRGEESAHGPHAALRNEESNVTVRSRLRSESGNCEPAIPSAQS